MGLLMQMESTWKLARVRGTLVFVLLYLSVRYGLSWLLSQIAVQLLGVPSTLLDPLVADNEMALQAAALAIASLAVMRLQARSSSFFASVRGLVPLPPAHQYWRLSTPLSVASDGFLKGFLISSLGVALVVFAGFARFEGSFSGLLMFLPVLLAEVALFVAWLLVVERGRNLLWKALVGPDDPSFSGRLLVVAFEAHLYFLLFDRANQSLGDRALLALVSALIASTMLLWFESGRRSATENWRVAMWRVGIQGGFWISLFHIYGFPMGDRRAVSLVHLFDGPLSERLSVMGLSGTSLLAVFVLLFVWASNTLLKHVVQGPTAWLELAMGELKGFGRSLVLQTVRRPSRSSGRSAMVSVDHAEKFNDLTQVS